MATETLQRSKKVAPPKKNAAARYAGKERRIAAGEFKAKCLAIIDEVNETRRRKSSSQNGVCPRETGSL